MLSGDILQILGGFVTLYKGFIRFGCRVGRVIYKGRFLMTFNLEPNMSLVTWTPDPKNESTFLPKFPPSTTLEKREHERRDGEGSDRNQMAEFQARIDAMLDEYPGLH